MLRCLLESYPTLLRGYGWQVEHEFIPVAYSLSLHLFLVFFPGSLAPLNRGLEEDMQGWAVRAEESRKCVLGKVNILAQSSSIWSGRCGEVDPQLDDLCVTHSEKLLPQRLWPCCLSSLCEPPCSSCLERVFNGLECHERLWAWFTGHARMDKISDCKGPLVLPGRGSTFLAILATPPVTVYIDTFMFYVWHCMVKVRKNA